MTDKDGDVKMNNNTDEVDENLYSRQLYVIGHEAMKSMQKSNVLVCGLNGIGVEIAKNVILAGVKSVTILDNTITSWLDLSSNFYLNSSHVGKVSRAEGSLNSLRELNRYVQVDLIKTNLTEELIKSNKYQVIVLIGYNLDDQIKYNKICHSNNIKFISSEGLGVFGSVFVDFGKDFLIKDIDGEQPFTGLIEIIEKGNPGIVRTHDDSRHGLSNGDYVTFEEVEGMTELNGIEAIPIKVKTPYSFEIGDVTKYSEYTGQGKFIQVKQTKKVSYELLSSQLDKPSLVYSDYGKDPNIHHIFYKALNKYRSQNNNNLPNPCSSDDGNKVVEIFKNIVSNNKDYEYIKVDEKLSKKLFELARCSSGIINPVAATLGGIVGQEVLKACTGKFTPIKQLFYFDSYESLPTCVDNDDQKIEIPLDSYKPKNSRYDSNIIVYGEDLQNKLLNSKMFLVGSGAIGCEMIKNWALLGVGCGKDGSVIVTDMDNIETSNLNRQFLFRNKDVGNAKSVTAAKVAKEMNPEMNIIAHENRVGSTTEEIYNDKFWTSLTCVCNALDNVQARLYVDTQCVNYKLPLLESGTLGTKGNTQIVVPNVTESYGSTRDPPEKDIPICTLKNFPHKIEHTIQWARDDFEGTFKQAPDEVNRYISEDNYLDELAKESATELPTLETIKKYLVDSKPIKFEECVHWARLKFEEEYCNKIKQLLFNFPEDSLTSSGTKFWSGHKRAPAPIEFNINDELHLNYIISASNLYAFIYRIQPDNKKETILKFIKSCKVAVFKPKEGLKIATTEEEMKEMKENENNNNDDDDDYDETVKQIKSLLPDRKTLSGLQLEAIEFEKDDDNNYHMDYITSCSNLRARNYRIKEVSKHETKGIAGKIIPAIATTTALVTGLITLEFFKILSSKKNIELYRNAFINLALPLCVQGEPAPCGTTKLELKKGNIKTYEYSLWDKIEIKNGKKMTLQNLIDYFANEWGLELSMISYGSAILYAFYMSPNKKSKREKAKLKKLVEAVTEKKLKPTQKYLMFEVGLNDEEDEDVEVPTVRVDISS